MSIAGLRSTSLQAAICRQGCSCSALFPSITPVTGTLSSLVLTFTDQLRLCVIDHVQAGHALVGALMPEYDPVQKISIVPRGQAGGLTFFAPSEERLESGLYSKSYLENQVRVAAAAS